MQRALKINNLFRYATSELSQDAFICWLLSYATEPGWNEDVQIRECAVALLCKILEAKNRHWTNNTHVTRIYKQYRSIDVLVQIDDLYVIIEDKTFTGTHDNQIFRYKKTLVDDGIDPQNIICVYYKIEEQPQPEAEVDVEFTRDNLLSIFRCFKGTINNPIFTDYLDYLEWIDYEISSYEHLPIFEWSPRAYIGLFKHLCNTILEHENRSWGYVSNQTGGFMGLWWDNILSKDELKSIGLDEEHDNLYLQIEDDIITVKYSMAKEQDPDSRARINKIRWKLYDHFRHELGEVFQKKKFYIGQYMTVGYVKYDESNCIEKLLALKNAMKKLRTYDFSYSDTAQR